MIGGLGDIAFTQQHVKVYKQIEIYPGNVHAKNPGKQSGGTGLARPHIHQTNIQETHNSLNE
ncbi:hypothetical protein MAALD49_17160 [Marinobacter shengliensis]|nr:hypothetical protein MAALD49_17160 [Marinobacter shengliensis]